MKKSILLLTLGLCISLVVACSGQKAPTTPSLTALEHIRLPMGYIPNVQYAPFYIAVEQGYYRQAGLEIEFDYSFETDGVSLVGANELPFAVVSGEQVLLARAQGLPVVYVFAWWQEYPVAVVSLKETPLESPADLAGKRIGIPGLFGASYVGLRALLDAGGLKEEDVILDVIGFNQVEALTAGQEEVVVVYANNEPIQLRQLGYETNLLRVADYVKLASNGLISNETTIQSNPDLVRRMVQATLKGLRDAINDPEQAFEICKKYVEGLEQLDRDTQMQILLASIEFWNAEHLGISEESAWENMHQVLLEMGLLTQPLDFRQAFTNQFVTGK